MVPYTALASPNTANHRPSPNRTARAPTSPTSAPGQAARRPAGASGRTRSSSTSSPKRIANGSTRVTANCAAATIQGWSPIVFASEPDRVSPSATIPSGATTSVSPTSSALAGTNGRVSLSPQASLIAWRKPPIAPLDE
jgi:hypothetical protein